MAKQWGHGYASGKMDALKQSAVAVENLQNPSVYAMAVLHEVMEKHPDKAACQRLHSAIMKSGELAKIYREGLWYGMSSGLLIDVFHPMTKQQAINQLEVLAKEK